MCFIGPDCDAVESGGHRFFHGSEQNDPTTILQRLPFSNASRSSAPTFSSARHSQRLPFSSACHSPATTVLQRLPFSSAYHSPAPTILQRLPFSSAYHSPATAILLRL